MRQLLKRNIFLYYVFCFFGNAMFWGAVLIPFFKEWGGLNQTQIQILQSFFMFSMMILEIPTGFVADVFGRKISLLLGACLPIIATLIYTSFRSYPIFFLAEFLFGAGYAFRSGADNAFIYDVLRENNEVHRAKEIYRRAESLRLIGIVASSLFGSFLAGFFSPRDVVFWSIIPAIITIFTALLFTEPKIKTEREEAHWMHVVKEGPRLVLKNPILRLLALDSIYIPALSYFVIWLYQPKLMQLGMPIIYFGVFHAILSLAQIVVLQTSVIWEKIFGSEKRYYFGTVGFVILGFIIVMLINHWLAVILFLILAGGFGLVRRTVLLAEVNRYIESDKRATTNSFINMMREIMIVVLNPIIGLLVDKDLNFGFFTLAALSFGGLLITIKAQKYEH